MKAGTIFGAALIRALAFTSASAADATPSEARAIAEEGFIHGLPLVMNYAMMNEFGGNQNSGQFKAPFNTIDNADHVFTYEDIGEGSFNASAGVSIRF